MSSHLPSTLLNLLRTWSHFILRSTGKSECFHFKYGKTAQRVGETHSRTHSIPVSVLGRIPGPPDLHAPALDLSTWVIFLLRCLSCLLTFLEFCPHQTSAPTPLPLSCALRLCVEARLWCSGILSQTNKPWSSAVELRGHFHSFPPLFIFAELGIQYQRKKNQSN